MKYQFFFLLGFTSLMAFERRAPEMMGTFKGYATVVTVPCETVASWILEEFGRSVVPQACQPNSRYKVVMMLGEQSDVGVKLLRQFRSTRVLQLYQEALFVVPYLKVSNLPERHYATIKILVDDQRIVRMGKLVNGSPKEKALFVADADLHRIAAGTTNIAYRALIDDEQPLGAEEVESIKQLLGPYKVENNRNMIQTFELDWLATEKIHKAKVEIAELSGVDYLSSEITPLTPSVYLDVDWRKIPRIP